MLAAEPGADAGAKADVGRSLTAIGRLLEAAGRTDEALASYRRSESLLASLWSFDPAARAAPGGLPLPDGISHVGYWQDG